MTCPNCGAAMASQTLDGHLGATVVIDLCLVCQVFWFDTQESLRLSPGAVLTLFRVIGERALETRFPVTNRPVCPRCQVRLFPTHDRQRNTPFQYLRCPKDHGRLISFVEFLREKDFIRPLSAQQIADLRESVAFVNCSNCGAPIDLAKSSACVHCGAPLSMLDLQQAGTLVAALREANHPDRPIDPALPLRLAQARREVEASFAAFERDSGWLGDVARGGLVGAGLSALGRWLKEHA
jgi:Zn-finger nucleic acid-binding protein